MQPRPQRVRAGRHRRGWRHRAWSWPFENQLIQIEAPDDVATTQTYAPATRNSDELRFSKETDTGITNFTWDNQNIIQEVDELNSVDAEYTLNPQPYGNLVSQRREAESTFYNYDALGSTESLTDESATKTDEYAYGAFGKILEQTGSTENPFGWVGELGYYREPDGRYDLRAREYEEAIARFLSEDPLRFDAGDENLYRYVRNNPTNAVDPSGLQVDHFPPVSGQPGYYHVYDSCGDLIATITYPSSCNTVLHPDWKEAQELAEKIAKQIDQHGNLMLLGKAIGQALVDAPEISIRLSSDIIDDIASAYELAKDPSFANLAGVLPLIPGATKKICKKTCDIPVRGTVPNKGTDAYHQLINKENRIANEIAAGGNRGITGTFNRAEADFLGERFVGQNFTERAGANGERILTAR